MTCRLATRDEVALILDWAAAEGWNPGLDDAAAFYAADPAGFFVAERDGAPVAAVSVVNHSRGVAFLGLYLCKADWRGQGVGFALWQHALAHAGGRSVGLDGVAAQQANYARSGFVRTGATLRWQGRLAAKADAAVRPAMPADAPVIAALDLGACGFARPAFLAAWLAECATRRSVVLDSGGVVTGFATLRLARDGCKIGPVVVATASDGLRLARAALAVMPVNSGPVMLDLPEANRPLALRLTALGFANSFTTARMFRGPPPVAGPTTQAIATMELG